MAAAGFGEAFAESESTAVGHLQLHGHFVRDKTIRICKYLQRVGVYADLAGTVHKPSLLPRAHSERTELVENMLMVLQHARIPTTPSACI